jgi:raffinose/stachyose/melibiose transport system substrate-binding protein
MKKRMFCLMLALLVLLTATGAVFAEGKTIVYWSMWSSSEPQAIVIAEAVKAYEAASGNTVDLQFKGRTGIREGLQPALDAGTEIDLFDEDIDRVNVAWKDYLLDLEELVKANDYEATALPSMIGAAREVAGGSLKSIPYQPNVFNMFYNVEIFEEAGIEAVPTTWEELLAASEKIKAAGYTALTTDDAYVMTNFGYQLARYIGEAGVVDVVTNGNWAETPEVLKAAQDYEDLYAKGYLSSTFGTSVWPTNQNGEFALGDVAMYLNGSWLPNEVKGVTGPDFKWGCFAYPAVPGGKDGIEAANFGAQVFAINKNTKVADEAFSIIEYITKGEFDKKLSVESVGIPADTTNAEWPEMLSAVKDVMAGLTTRYQWSAGIENNPDMTPIIKENFQKLCTGKVTAQEFVDALEAASK